MKARFTSRAAVWLYLGCLSAVALGPSVALAERKLKAGDPLPAFSLPRADGAAGEFASSQLQGQPAVIVFWRPNQKLSLDVLRELQSMTQEMGTEKLRIVAVDAGRSTAGEVQAALSAESLSLPVVLDPKRDLYGAVGVIVSPTTLMFDSKGILRFAVASRPRQYAQIIRARLRHLLGETSAEEMAKEIEPTVLKIDHELAAAWRMYNLGRRLQTEGKAEEAVAAYEKAVARYPSLPEARCALGFMKLSAGDLSAAGELFRSSIAYQPSSPSAHLGLAAVQARTGLDQQAEQTLLGLLRHKSVAVRVRYELGRIYRGRGELGKAVTYFEDALEAVFPEQASASSAAAPSSVASPTPSAELPRKAKVSRVAPAAAAPTAKSGGASQAIQPIELPADAHYIGTKRCKKCHLQQWKTWQDTKMAKAFDLLKPGTRADKKQSRGLDAQKDYRTDPQCLACHTTGFGISGGYEVPPPGDARAARTAAKFAGVGCECCHGPGKKFAEVHKDIQENQRQFAQAELYAAGQFEVVARVCARCHDERAACIGPGYDFDYAERKEQGTHKHYDLKFRKK